MHFAPHIYLSNSDAATHNIIENVNLLFFVVVVFFCVYRSVKTHVIKKWLQRFRSCGDFASFSLKDLQAGVTSTRYLSAFLTYAFLRYRKTVSVILPSTVRLWNLHSGQVGQVALQSLMWLNSSTQEYVAVRA